MEERQNRSTGIIVTLIVLGCVMMGVNFFLVMRRRTREVVEEGVPPDIIARGIAAIDSIPVEEEEIPPDIIARGLLAIDSLPVKPGSSLQQGEALDRWQLVALRRLEALHRVDPLPDVIPSRVSKRREREGFFESTVSYLASDDTTGWASIYCAVDSDAKPQGAIVLFLDHGRPVAVKQFADAAPNAIVVVPWLATSGTDSQAPPRLTRAEATRLAKSLLAEGDSLAARRVRDALRLVKVIKQLDDIDEDRVAAVGAAGSATVALSVAAIDREIAATAALVTAPAELDDEHFLLSVTPGMSVSFDRIDLAALIAPRRLLAYSKGALDPKRMGVIYESGPYPEALTTTDEGEHDAFIATACRWALAPTESR